MRVELDKKSIMALASDTRMDILKSLQPMRRTVSQLSDELKMDKAGVHRHLKKLEEGGLVKRYEDHGFVYYGLSWKARDLLAPNENTKIVILLSAFWIVTLVMVLYVAAAMMSQAGNDRLDDLLPAMDGEGDSASDYESLSDGGWSLVSFAPFILLGSAMVILVVLTLRQMRMPLQAKPETSMGFEGQMDSNSIDE